MMQAPVFGIYHRHRLCVRFSFRGLSLPRIALAIFLAAFASPNEGRADSSVESVTLFAAASTTNALAEIVELYKDQSDTRVRTVFAASSTLSKQIVNGAPADLFLSANERWMEHLIDKAAVDPKSKRALFGNRLVLVVGPNNEAESGGQHQKLSPSLPLGEILGTSRLAIGDPAHVPAGIYAKAAMQSLDLWDDYSDKLAFSGNVRTALALVERGEAAAGIVYETDALILPKLGIVGTFPPGSHPPIIYPLAIVTDRHSKAVEDFYGFLAGPEAAKIFARHGFSPSGALQ
ncbi:molybdate ABC transporter substrate-binding protein [Denitrobaculum tricleocarpae]|uniref:Molybdate ABC transporter substrate-binding protein n=1 Tax=Denitrobaculum tricleocarpae TaxID=2591009 RepID=A0A545TQ48_9PROT|nr:molybdate ABC transporter substrate-binding protein [Denitrobaculum tricleocarpae]TQV79353.1 molybdate ABC transporter substrate-binding protein [Denitrobaculum tricleocarpae]